jgi:MoxR-like ATPase
VFANAVLADEINRAPPKTQAALLEAMEEGQVTAGGETHELPTPFFVVATQNPVEQKGTFELPEAQLDRFVVKTAMGYPDRKGELYCRLYVCNEFRHPGVANILKQLQPAVLELLDRRAERTAQAPTVEPVTDRKTVRRLRRTAETVRVDRKVQEYAVDLGRATRNDDRVAVGVSPRGVQCVFEAARARVMVSGREHVAPDDVKQVTRPVVEHRMVLTPEARVRDVDARSVLDAAPAEPRYRRPSTPESDLRQYS